MKLRFSPAREESGLLDTVAALDRACSPVLRSADRCRQLLAEGGQLNLALAEDEVLGFAALSLVLDEATLLNLVVAPSARGRGVGRRLLAYSCERLQARDVRRLLLEVRAGNAPAIALYHALGCRDDGLRRNYYAARDGMPAEDARLMSLDLEVAHAGARN